MATEITMPKLSDTMTEGRLISWKKGVGEQVNRGDIIAEVETDKANMELEAFTSGVLLETRVTPGELVPVGTVIGIVGAAGEAVAAAPVAVVPEPAVTETAAAAETAPAPAPEEPPPVHLSVAGEEAVKASPAVRRLARELGIDLQTVQGTGPDGRVLQEDLERLGGAGVTVAEPAAQPAVAETAPVAGTEPAAPRTELHDALPLSRMRSAIAQNVSTSWRTTPHFSVTVEIVMDAAAEVVRELREGGTPVSYNDLIVKACAMALFRFPQLNNSFAGDGIRMNADVNIGVAVGLPEGLLIPVVRECQRLSLREIAAESRRLAERARTGSISQQEISGGTFTISNLGMYGVDEFASIILPPQAAILAVGAVADRPVVRDGSVVAAKTMRATLSADHRIVDGLYVAQFLGEVKRLLENPVLMLV